MRRLLSVSLAVFFSLLMLGSVHADTPPTLSAYHEQVRAAYAAAQRRDRLGLEDSAGTLTAIHTVKLDDGTELPVDNSWLPVTLAQEPPPFPLITARLGAILDALGLPHQAAPAGALKRLEGVFTVPPFRDRAVPSAITKAWTGFWSAVGRLLQRIADWLFGGSSPPNRSRPTAPAASGPGTGWTGLSGWGLFWLVIGLLLVLTIMVYAVRGLRASRAQTPPGRSGHDEEADLTSAAARQRAETEARRGDYRQAVRSLYLSSLLWLHEQHLLRYDQSLTNREYLHQLEGQVLQSRLDPIVATFDRVWYGRRELDPAEFAAYEAQIAGLRSAPDRQG